jgi:hypothetical protein
MKRGEVQRHVGSELGENPARHLVELSVRVVLARYQKGRDLEPDIGFVLEIEKSVQHRLEMPATDLPVEIVGKGLEIHVRSIHVAVELRPRLGADLGRCHRHREHPPLTTGLGNVDGVLVEDDRIVVGKGDTAAAEALRRSGNHLG